MNCIWFRILLRINKVNYGSRLTLNGMPCIFRRNGSITIGNNVTINSGFLTNLTGINHRTIITTKKENSEIVIGDNVGISGATIYARSSIRIGNNVFIGSNVKILDSDFHPLDAEERNQNNKTRVVDKPIVIKNDCFIGCDSIILKGTILGERCVVGAGAVVSGVFEPGSVIVGNPGKTIRCLF